MKGKIFGGSLLIIGTAIGAGMLALPLVTASGSFPHTMMLFFSAWLLTLFGTLYTLEANLWFPETANFITMSRATLGRVGHALTWLAYLFLLYGLMSAYALGGAEILRNILNTVNVSLPSWANSLLFMVLFGSVVHIGMHAVDFVNRGLMTFKLSAFVLLSLLLSPYIEFDKIYGVHTSMLSSAIIIVLTSFCVSVIVPSLRTYYKSDFKALKLTIYIGSISIFLIYLSWYFVVHGTISSTGPHGLMAMASSENSISDLTTALSRVANSSLVSRLTHFFTMICMVTSFLGASACLSHSLADVLKSHNSNIKKWLVTFITFFPSFILTAFYQKKFIQLLNYAGIFCVIVMVLLPAVMVFSGRYWKKMATGYQVCGGIITLTAVIVLTIMALVWGIMSTGV